MSATISLALSKPSAPHRAPKVLTYSPSYGVPAHIWAAIEIRNFAAKLGVAPSAVEYEILKKAH